MLKEKLRDVTGAVEQRKRKIEATLVVVGTVVVANLVYILNIRSNNPILYRSGLGSPSPGQHGWPWPSGHWEHTIDPNEGWTAQALGRLAAEMWKSGDLPLWNLYEGLGQPLAGEMQSAALFVPFIFLQLLPDGIFAFHLALELVAGLTTLLFLRQLKLSWLASSIGASLFAVNGAFSLMTNAPFNPIAFLPMALWGSELILSSTHSHKRPVLGVWVLALSVCCMLFSGFPETAYLECLFVLVWALARLGALHGVRLKYLAWLGVATVLGVLMASPILVAFGQHLRFGFVGYHSGDSSRWNYGYGGLVNFATPYLLGPYGVKPTGNSQAGYVTILALSVAALALTNAYRRPQKACLGLIFAVLFLNMFGFRPVNIAINLVPGIKNILLYKYGYSLVAFAVVVLIAFALDDIRARRISGRAVLAVGAGALAALAGVLARDNALGFLSFSPWIVTAVAMTFFTLVAALILVLMSRSTQPRRAHLAAVLLGVVVLLDGSVMYAIPQLGASESKVVDTAPIKYLQSHLGTSRFYTLGPIQPNYGSYWKLAQINVNDLPVPKKMSTYLKKNLAPAKGTPGARGTSRAFIAYELTPLNFSPKVQRTLLIAYGQQQKYFRDAGVKYLVTAPGVVARADESKYGLRHVFTSRTTEIYEDDKAASYYQTTGARCTRLAQDFESVRLRCDAPAKLTRLQLLTPGWNATVNNRQIHLQDRANEYFQTVNIPAGTTTVKFHYMPQYFRPAVAVSLLIATCGTVDVALLLMRRRIAARHGRRGRNRLAAPLVGSGS